MKSGIKPNYELSNEFRNPSHNGVSKLTVGKHTIYQGDCRDSLKMISDGSIDLIITSPPYNIGVGDEKWADSLPNLEYYDLTQNWISECYRILADGGKICANLPLNDYQNIAFEHFNIMKKMGFKLVTNIVWVKWDAQRKEKFAVSKWKLNRFRESFLQHKLINTFELVMVMEKKRNYTSYVNDLSDQELQEWKYNTWFIRPLVDRVHPAPFPPELVMRLIKLYSIPNQSVLDPFLGSGTTMAVAERLNRVCTGCELEPSYIQMTKDRMSKIHADS